MKKADLRKLYLQKMSGLTKEEQDLKSKNIASIFISSFDLNQYNSLHVFLPILKNNEVNTHYIIQEAKRINPQVSIIIPKSDFKNLSMSSHVLSEETELVATSAGMLEPIAGTPFDDEKIDIVIVPLLAFDKRGFRVGYGKGFYDRFLKKCREDLIKIGVSLFEPIESIEDINENDVPLDYCITPEELISIG